MLVFLAGTLVKKFSNLFSLFSRGFDFGVGVLWILRRFSSWVSRGFKICYGEALLRRQEVPFISGIFTAHARVLVSGRSRTACYGKTTRLTYCWLRESLLPLFLCFIGCFIAYRMDQFIEKVLVNDFVKKWFCFCFSSVFKRQFRATIQSWRTRACLQQGR